MKVEIWIESGFSAPPGKPRKLIPVFEYTDRISKTVTEAADRAWRITNAAIIRLEGEELHLRTVWDTLNPGRSLSVGDVVVVDGRRVKCRPFGWD